MTAARKPFAGSLLSQSLPNDILYGNKKRQFRQAQFLILRRIARFYFAQCAFQIFSCGRGAKALAFFQKGGILMAIPRG